MSTKKERIKKQATVGAVGVAAAASVLVGTVIDTPAELIDNSIAAEPIVEFDDDDDSQDNEDENKGSRAYVLKNWILSLPQIVRLCVFLPLWVIGHLLICGAEFLYEAAFTPVGSTILSWVLAALIAWAVLGVTAKAMFPDTPIKELMKPRHFFIIFIGMAILGIADFVVPNYWPEYATIGKLIRLVGGALVVGLGVVSVRSLYRRRKRREEKALKNGRTDVENAAMALADTVCP